ncbi:MAG: hypothetical protein M0R46_06585 [Candidatus Muirbacterium halophilum]|nr:hypothetical protein [Candidatus Muirbacterium halophilum]
MIEEKKVLIKIINRNKSFYIKLCYDIIASLDNLCITKRSINSSKCSMNKDEFMLQLKKQRILKQKKTTYRLSCLSII